MARRPDPDRIAAAKAAGMTAVALTTTYPREELRRADAIVPSLASIRIGTIGNAGIILELSS